ncbi:hypothetical protein NA57DRAFT_59734 [Rhizodiscina lignyota]|uniref:Uncharacterized protein n=1 Tax=Rhizodiscina lignyota TaxID=1504668 RepID=A0A9P4M3I8_9PEZI|nr:hypothetical protein NA57DRAFT_59734 [Rhizodiscina lignyota]
MVRSSPHVSNGQLSGLSRENLRRHELASDLPIQSESLAQQYVRAEQDQYWRQTFNVYNSSQCTILHSSPIENTPEQYNSLEHSTPETTSWMERLVCLPQVVSPRPCERFATPDGVTAPFPMLEREEMRGIGITYASMESTELRETYAKQATKVMEERRIERHERARKKREAGI